MAPTTGMVPPRMISEEKFERQKKMLQKMTLTLLETGATTGLTDYQVRTLQEALVVLGWLPEVKL